METVILKLNHYIPGLVEMFIAVKLTLILSYNIRKKLLSSSASLMI